MKPLLSINDVVFLVTKINHQNFPIRNLVQSGSTLSSGVTKNITLILLAENIPLLFWLEFE